MGVRISKISPLYNPCFGIGGYGPNKTDIAEYFPIHGLPFGLEPLRKVFSN